MELKHKEVKRYYVEYYDLQNFIAQKYDLKNFCAIGEQGNDTVIEVSAQVEPLDESDLDKLEKALKFRYLEGWNLSVIMNDMCNKGLIEPGDYIINVSW